MSELAPLEVLNDVSQGDPLPLPPELARLYGSLRLPRHPGRPHVYSNFVESLDGVVSLGIPGKAGGGEISGFDQHDRAVMGLLRAVADAVVVGAGTVRLAPVHLWTAQYIFPDLAGAYHELRAALGKPPLPPTVIVTGRGDLDPGLRVLHSSEVPLLVVTTEAGARMLGELGLPASVEVEAVGGAGRLGAGVVLEALSRRMPGGDLVLVEGGPHLLGNFLAEARLDELFLTLAPQVAGRDEGVRRLGLVEGQTFAPEHPLWGTLVAVRRGGSHLFLRYQFAEAARRV